MTIAATASELRTALQEEREATGKPPTKKAFADFHIHTRFSRDSILTEEKFIEKAIERGLTHVCVTNHNNVEGAIAVRDKVAELGLADQLTVILGEEVSTADGEVVGIFLTKTIPRGLSANETADEIHRQGGLVSIPHPFDPFRGSHIRVGPLRNLAEIGEDRRHRGLQLSRHIPATQPGGRRVREALRHSRHRRIRQPLELRGGHGLQCHARLRRLPRS